MADTWVRLCDWCDKQYTVDPRVGARSRCCQPRCADRLAIAERAEAKRLYRLRRYGQQRRPLPRVPKED